MVWWLVWLLLKGCGWIWFRRFLFVSSGAIFDLYSSVIWKYYRVEIVFILRLEIIYRKKTIFDMKDSSIKHSWSKCVFQNNHLKALLIELTIGDKSRVLQLRHRFCTPGQASAERRDLVSERCRSWSFQVVPGTSTTKNQIWNGTTRNKKRPDWKKWERVEWGRVRNEVVPSRS